MEIDQTLDIKQNTILDKIVLLLAVGMFTITIGLAAAQVLIRQFNLPISAQWTEPLARFILIITTYFGAALATRNREHIRMAYLLDKIKEKYPNVRQAFDLVSSIIVIGFLLFALWGTVPATGSNWYSNMGGVAIVTAGHLYLGISLGLAFMLLYEIIHLYDNYLKERLLNQFSKEGRPWS